MTQRPQDANADAWYLFLREHETAPAFVAVQIAEAIDVAQRIGASKTEQNPLHAAIAYAFEVQRRGFVGLYWLDRWLAKDPGALQDLEEWQTAKAKPRQRHAWGPSRVGHGEAQCTRCRMTNREAIALAQEFCHG